MSLAKYTKTRLVVLRPAASAYEAVRAMEDNHTGAVIIHDGTEVVGMVTDRDLALITLGYELEPLETQLRDVMSVPVAVLPSTATALDAALLMAERHVRRIPLVDDGQLVGLVTLDDLLIAQSVDAPTLAAIVHAQLSEPSRLKPKGKIHPEPPAGDPDARRERAALRHAARTQLAYDSLLRRVLTATGLATPERAEGALLAVLSGIVRRITPDEGRQLLAQFPTLLRERFADTPRGPDRSVTRSLIAQTVAERLEVDKIQATAIVLQVWTAISQTISAGELSDVRSQLPTDMRESLAAISPD